MFYTELDGVEGTGATVTFSGAEASHLARSLRAKPGEHVTASDGRGLVCEVRLESVEMDSASGRVVALRRSPRESPRITVFQAMGRTTRMDEALAAGAEAGAAVMVPFVSDRSPAGSREKAEARLGRWRRIAAEASKVARRPWMMEVSAPLPGIPSRADLRSAGLCVLLWESEEARVFADTLPERAPEGIGFLVGPEGGFSEREARSLEADGAVPASMGDLILRTQTAGAHASMLARFRYRLLVPGGAEAPAAGEVSDGG